jgi:hypothetical protein
MSWDDGAHRSERRLLIWTLEACFGMYFFRPFEKFESDAGQVLSIVALRASHVLCASCARLTQQPLMRLTCAMPNVLRIARGRHSSPRTSRRLHLRSRGGSPRRRITSVGRLSVTPLLEWKRV